MPVIFLMRHGEAEARATTDEERQLTEYGKEYTVQIAQQFCDYLAKSSYPLPLLLHSPYVRAIETATILESRLKAQFSDQNQEQKAALHTVAFRAATPDQSAQSCLAALEEINSESVMLVSHMPIIASLASLLEHGNVFQDHGFQTSEIRCFESEHWAPGGATFKVRLL